MVQRATGPRLLRDRLRPAGLEPRPHDRQSGMLTTMLSRHLLTYDQLKPFKVIQGHQSNWPTFIRDSLDDTGLSLNLNNLMTLNDLELIVLQSIKSSPGQLDVVVYRARPLDVQPEVPERLTRGTDEKRLELLDRSE